jgi:3-methylfumaryl-CoA hydratase
MSRYDTWVGRREEREEVISAVPLRLLAAALDIEPGDPQPGDPVPLLWHWLYFLPDLGRSALGPDGHPRRGLFFPPISGRRMFAGANVRVPGTLRVGDHATQIREIASVEEKEGRTGPLFFVRVEVSIHTPRGPVLEETQTIVYTDAPPAVGADSSPAVPDAPWQSAVPTDPALLFRFSALTFNAHRIHYDHDYATGVEGYQGLVVHGPLTAILLADMASRHGLSAREFSFRGVAPIMCGEVVQLRGTPIIEGAELAAYAESGALAARAMATGSKDDRRPSGP